MKQIFVLSLLFATTTTFSQPNWQAVTGAGSAKTPMENMSLAVEIFVLHDHIDKPIDSDWTEGQMINRHIWKTRKIIPPSVITRDSKGEDETPEGAFISLASRPISESGYGGELFDEGDGKTAHQRDWDYLATHVEKAYEMYKAYRLQNKGFLGQFSTSSLENANELSDWEKCQALCHYALQWKMKTSSVYTSFHPVDVMHHSSFCTGPANILHALSMVAGFESRFIATANHSMVEIKIKDKWYWFDNNAYLNGYHLGVNNYAEVTSNPDDYLYINEKQKGYLFHPVARYRAPYHYSGRYYWHFCWGSDKGYGGRNDIKDGFGVTVPYDPSCAAALYPEMKEHTFFIPKDWPAVVNLSEKGSFIRATHPITEGMSVRKRFFVDESKDNPIKGGKIKLQFHGKGTNEQIECYIDDTKLEYTGTGTRFGKPLLEYNIPASLLTPGEHDFIVKGMGKKIYLWFYPDIVEPYFPPASQKIELSNKAFFIDPYFSDDDLEELKEKF